MGLYKTTLQRIELFVSNYRILKQVSVYLVRYSVEGWNFLLLAVVAFESRSTPLPDQDDDDSDNDNDCDTADSN